MASRKIAIASLALVATGGAVAMYVLTREPPPPPRPRTGITEREACPEGMTLVEHSAELRAFCIDRWEASLVDIGDDGRESPHSPFDMVGNSHVRAVSLGNVMPQAYISRNEAVVACTGSKKYLCKEAEWVVACEGPGRNTYPWGNERRPGACNDSGKAPILALFGGRAGAAYSSMKMLNDPLLNQQPSSLTLTGSHAECRSSGEVFDMVGNLHEWIDDAAGTFRGGFYLDTTLNGEGCKYRTVAHDASYHDYSTGFRCCAEPRR